METEATLRTKFDLEPLPVEHESKSYWVGTLPSCPQFNVALAGVQFHRYTDPPTGRDADSGETKRAYRKGCVEQLTEAKVQTIMNAMRNKVVQWKLKKDKETGQLSRGEEGFVMSTDSKQYFRQKFDEPLAKYVYLLPVTEAVFSQVMSMDDTYPKSCYDVEVERLSKIAASKAEDGAKDPKRK